MSNYFFSGFHYLDHCVGDFNSLQRTRKVLEKFEKICEAIGQGANLADLLQDKASLEALAKDLGPADFEAGIQLLLKLSLHSYRNRSFTLYSGLDQKKVDFVYRSVAAWKQFNTVLCFQIPGVSAPDSIVLVNPQKSYHWKSLPSVPEGTLVTAFLKTPKGAASASQEDLALERYEALFEMLQGQADIEVQPAPVLQVNPDPAKPAATPKPMAKAPAKKSSYASRFSRAATAPSGPPSFSFKLVISKMDVFVHAGNAHLIMTHIRDYPGTIQFFVLRDKKQRVQMDADSIWGAEIRNGEQVMFEFYGPKPKDEFVKELAKKVNKYTQMDKVANE